MRIDPKSSALVLLLVASACASTADETKGSIEWLINHGRFEEALRTAAAAAEQNPNDEQAQIKHRGATLAFLLDQGRRLTFDDQDLEALEVFEKARELAPHRPEPVVWMEKTRHKLADRYLTHGLEAHASDKLEAAIEAYEGALKFEPGNRSALTGMAEATLALNYRAGLGRGYYEDGLHSLATAWLEQARGEFQKADKYLEEAQLDQRQEQVALELALQRITVAEALEAEGKFDAARNEYRLAMSLDPQNERARAGKESCDLEAHAAQIYRDADMSIVRGRHDKALELAEEGARLTQKQKDRFDGLKNRIQEARYETLYREGLSLERDGKFPEAVQRYDDLLKIAAYYKDALTRKETLEDFIQRADRLYTQAAGEGDTAKKLEIMRQILQFWPDYRDVADQVRELSKTVPPQ